MILCAFEKPYKVGVFPDQSDDVVYSDIVDRSDFRFKDETSRISRLSEQNTGSFSPVYDYENGKIPNPDDDPVTDTVVNLRQGLYNRGEIDDMRRAIDSKAESESKAAAESEKAVKAASRQAKVDAAIDKALGVESDGN